MTMPISTLSSRKMLRASPRYPVGGDGSRGARELGRPRRRPAPLPARARGGPGGGLEASPGLPHPSVNDQETTRSRQRSSHAAGRFSYYGN